MKKIIYKVNFAALCIILWLLSCSNAFAQLTIDSCQHMARLNYPQIKQYDLIKKSNEYNISNIAKGYLPQITLNGKASHQSDITSFPGMALQLPLNQYSVSLDLYQSIWDGGALKAESQSTEASSEVNIKQLETDMYSLKDRVNQLFFGILFIQAQLQQNELLQNYLLENVKTVENAINNGVANNADLDAIKVEQIQANQTEIQMNFNKKAYMEMLQAMIGTKIDENTEFQKPDSTLNLNSQQTIERPEMGLFDARNKQIESQYGKIKSNIMPKFGLFATAAYALPGLNMMNIDFSPYYIVGAKFSWNLSAFYTNKNQINNIKIQESEIETQKQVFLYNTNQQLVKQNLEIKRISEEMKSDDEIIKLRENIRKNSEVKLANGTLTSVELMRQLMLENTARENKIQHQIQYLIAIYNLKTITNN